MRALQCIFLQIFTTFILISLAQILNYRKESVDLYNKGVYAQSKGHVVEAIERYKEALAGFHEFPEAHQNLGILMESSLQFDTAIYHHEQSVIYASDNIFKSAAIINLVLTNLKGSKIKNKDFLTKLISKLGEAEELLTNENPNPNIYFTSGLIYDMIGDSETSLKYFQYTITLDPNHSLAYLNIGNYYFKLNDFKMSAEYYNQCINTINNDTNNNNNFLFVLNNIGQCYREQGLLNKALQSFSKALSIINKDSEKYIKPWTLNNVYAISGLLCNWKNFEIIENSLESEIIMINNNNNYIVHNSEFFIDPYTVSLMAFSNPLIDKIVSEMSCAVTPIFNNSFRNIVKKVGGLLKIGYLSYDWRDHPMGRLTSFLVTHHNYSKIDPISLSYGTNDNSIVRKYIEKYSKSFIDISEMKNNVDISELINSMDFDIIIDLTAHTYNGRIEIAAMKPSPIIVNYLGLPGTTGCIGFDYSMVHHTLVPPEYYNSIFTENLVYLPHTYQSNNMPMDIAPCTDRMKCREERKTIPINKITQKFYDQSYIWICSFNANKKMESISFSSWMNILKRISNSILLLQEMNEESKNNIINQFHFHGISSSRVIFLPKLGWKDHLYRSASCDIVLDTFIYGAHTTSSDMLWVWVPLLTLESWGHGKMPSRVATSIIKSLSSDITDERVFTDNNDNNNNNNNNNNNTDNTDNNNNTDNTDNTGNTDNNDKTDNEYIYESSSWSDCLNIMIEYSVKSYEDTAIRLMSTRRSLDLLHERIGYFSLRSPTFNSFVMEDAVEQTYQMMFEVSIIKKQNNINRYNLIIPTNEANNNKYINLITTPLNDLFTSDMDTSVSGEIFEILEKKVEKYISENRYFSFVDTVISISRRILNSFPVFQTPSMLRIASIIYRKKEEIIITETTQLDSCIVVESINNITNIINNYLLLNSLPKFCEFNKLLLWNNPLESEIQTSLPFLVNNIITLDCNQESAISDILFSLLFKKSNKNDFLSPIYNEIYDNKIIEYSLIWNHTIQKSDLSKDFFNFIIFFLSKKRYFNNSESIDILIPYLCKNNDFFCENNFINEQLSLILSNHAVCLDRIGNQLNGLYFFLNSFLIYSDSFRNNLNIGLIIMDLGETNYGFLIASHAIILEHNLSFHKNENIISSPDNRRIVIYCNEYGQSWWPGWGPSSIDKNGHGMGGSEEAVYYVSIELAKLGYNVEVFTDLMDIDIGKVFIFGDGCVVWNHLNSFDINESCDVFIAWRYSLSLSLSKNANKAYLWLHDLIPAYTLPTSFFNVFDGIFVQSLFHKSFIENNYKVNNKSLVQLINSKKLRNNNNNNFDSIYIIPNGIKITNDLDGPNNKDVFIYGSAPNRGLRYVLLSWKKIKESIPFAKLKVYYGFTESFKKSMRETMSEIDFNIWYEEMLILLNQDGIEYIGSVNHEELTIAYKESGFLLYPTDYPETGCITVLRAMSCGCIPITSRFENSVLYNLTFLYDMGPLLALNSIILKNNNDFSIWLDSWINSVINAYYLDNNKLEEHRMEMKTQTRNSYSWEATARTIKEIIF